MNIGCNIAYFTDKEIFNSDVGSKLKVGGGKLVKKILTGKKIKVFVYSYVQLCKKVEGGLSPPPLPTPVFTTYNKNLLYVKC